MIHLVAELAHSSRDYCLPPLGLIRVHFVHTPRENLPSDADDRDQCDAGYSGLRVPVCAFRLARALFKRDYRRAADPVPGGGQNEREVQIFSANLVQVHHAVAHERGICPHTDLARCLPAATSHSDVEMLQPTNLPKYILPHLVSCRILASCAEIAWFVKWRSMVFVAYRTKSVWREQLRFQGSCVRAARSETSLRGLLANSSGAAKAFFPWFPGLEISNLLF